MALKSHYNVVLIGSGIMSTTVATLMDQFAPDKTKLLLEQFESPCLESTDPLYNAGTGHAAYCELNYTAQLDDGTIDTSKASAINDDFLTSLRLWSYLVANEQLPSPEQFINVCPHMSYVWGEDNVAFLKARHEAITQLPAFSSMEYTEDLEEIKRWAPLLDHKSDDDDVAIAATRIAHGSDVNFAAVTKGMLDALEQSQTLDTQYGCKVQNLSQNNDGTWLLDTNTGEFTADFVFIGAGGASLHLLQKSGIAQCTAYAGFPVSGQFLVCDKAEIIAQHSSKVYGLAPVGAPPMSVPHLDMRMIDGKQSLLFGPFAGFTTKFLSRGSILDMFKSLRFANLLPMLSILKSNFSLLTYLIKQSLQSHSSRMAALRDFYPDAKDEDWSLLHAGKRVQVIRIDSAVSATLQFGTEVIEADDKSLACLMGASPGASVSAKIALNVMNNCFADVMSTPESKALYSEIFEQDSDAVHAALKLK